MDTAALFAWRARNAEADTAPPTDGAPDQPLLVRHGNGLRPVRPEAIALLRSADRGVELVVEGRALLVRATLESLLRRLDGARFLRVHRSAVVNLDYVEAFERYPGGRLRVVLSTGHAVIASRARSRELRRRSV